MKFNIVIKGDILNFIGNEIEMLGIRNDKIIYSGRKLPRNTYESKIEFEISEDHIVIPGFVDSHIHLKGLSMIDIDLRNISKISELKNELVRISKSKRKNEWIIGFGWDQEKIGQLITNKDIDDVVNDKPVILFRICGHMAILNTYAMKMLNVNFPDGIVVETDLENVKKRILLNQEELLKRYVEITEDIVKTGILQVHSMSVSEIELNILKKIENSLNLDIRLYVKPDLIDKINHYKFNSDKIKVCGVKIFMDGSLGSWTAAISKPYKDKPGTTGILHYRFDNLKDFIIDCILKNLQIAIHAIGDLAIEEVIKTIEFLNIKTPLVRIEHASMIRDEILEKFKILKPYLVINPHFVITDWWIWKRLPDELAKCTYRFNELIQVCTCGIGSDAPVEPYNPFIQIRVLLEKGCKIEDVLKAYTINGIILSNDNLNLYNLRTGSYANLIVIPKNTNEIKNCKKPKLVIYRGKIIQEELNNPKSF